MSSIWNIGSGARERADAARAPARDDSLAVQRLALVSEQRTSRTVDIVAATFRPAGEIPNRPAKRLAPIPRPVAPVLSGRDQGSPTPQMVISHPLADARCSRCYNAIVAILASPVPQPPCRGYGGVAAPRHSLAASRSALTAGSTCMRCLEWPRTHRAPRWQATICHTPTLIAPVARRNKSYLRES
jgi:hypothetical protein